MEGLGGIMCMWGGVGVNVGGDCPPPPFFQNVCAKQDEKTDL